MPMSVQDVKAEVNRLALFWSPRQSAFKQWYKMIQLHNDLHQDKMESVISSDPRTSFNMAKWLVKPRTSAFVVDTDGFTDQESQRVGTIERYADRQFVVGNRRQRVSLFGSPIDRLVGLMLATGWYAIASVPTPHGWAEEVWNPAQVWPWYDSSNQMTRLGRRYSVRGGELNLQIARNRWIPPKSGPFPDRNFDVYHLWWLTPFGLAHTVVAGNEHIKPPTISPLGYIPVFTGPVTGLPDDGAITGPLQWKAEVGESLIAPVMDIQKNYDKMLTYLQQLLRDTANPRWLERVKGESNLDPERLFDRGAVFTYDVDEGLDPIPTPPLPPEIRGHQFDLRAQIQRGMFSDISFGNITQQVSGFLMSQVTSTAKQSLSPFFDAVKAVEGEKATRNIATMRQMDIPLGRDKFPQMPEDITLDFVYDIEIPGDFMQRVSAARVANPEFRLSTATLHSVMFPEVQNSLIEQSRIRAEDATNNPVFRQVLLLRELSQAVQHARTNNDEEMAQWLERAVQLIEGQGFGESQPGESSQGQLQPTSNALPPEVAEVLAGGG